MADVKQGSMAKASKKERKAAKPKVMRWRGLLEDTQRRVRIGIYALMVVAIVTLVFTQLGLVGLGAPGAYLAYGNVLLAIVALGGLLFGVWRGTLLGLIAGIVMSVHANVQPLDYFEVTFITPAPTIIGFTIVAFLMSLFISLVMRGKPSRLKGVIGIIVVCSAMSLLYTFFFAVNVFISVVGQILVNYTGDLSATDTDMLNTVAFSLVSQLGRLDIQAVFDAALMAAVCIGAWVIVDRIAAKQGRHRIIFVFRSWLFGVVILAFMLAAAISFVIVTEQAKESAHESMGSEIGYVSKQLESYDARMALLAKLLAEDKVSGSALSDDEVEMLERAFSIDNLLDGYNQELDGSVVVFEDGKVLLSDDPLYKVGDSADLYFDIPFKALSELSKSGEMIAVAYDRTAPLKGEVKSISEYSNRPIATEVAYMQFGSANDYVVMMMYPSSMVFASRSSVMTWTTLTVVALLVVVFLFTSRLLNSLVVRRIDETNGVLSSITDGDLTARVNVRDTLEFGSLSTGINTTVNALRGWIAEAETRMEAELATAKAIQESALPRTFPPFPDNLHFDIYADMRPAREVGGDFYDFFLIGDDCTPDHGRLGFVIADVSGKGVPAALFMMTAKTLIRDYMGAGLEIGEAVENANRQLCAGNDTGMFVTVFAGALDYATGAVSYVNAGHNPPLVWQAGAWRWITEKSGMPLGLFDGFPYETFSMNCTIGDEFLLYTDGVTEAMDPEGQLFGEERLMELVQENYRLHPRRLVHAVRSELSDFVREADQSDDITMLALEVGVPPEITATLTVPAKLSELPHVLDFVHTELDRRLCPLKTQKQLEIAIEELYVNVAHYAYPEATDDNPGLARISYTYNADPPCVTIEIADDGVAFDPLAKPDAVTPDDIMDVPIGGLGILMAKKSVDEMTYARIDSSNVVTLKKKW